MELNVSNEKKAFILLDITRELIRQSGGELFILKTTLDSEAEQMEEEKEEARKITNLADKSVMIIPQHEKISEKPRETIEIISPLNKEDEVTRSMVLFENKPLESERKIPRKIIRPPVGARVLRIPAPKLPKGFEHLKPMPIHGKTIDLGKLNLFLQDPKVASIEINGPDEKVFVDGVMGKKPTSVVLAKEEIDEIINKFSSATKIPASEGIYRVVFGNLMLLAIISNVIGSKFVIKKIQNQGTQIPNQLPKNPLTPPRRF
jgi:hypothetical protein